MIEFLGEAHAMKAYLETRLRDAEERAEKAERERDDARARLVWVRCCFAGVGQPCPIHEKRRKR
jgi:hypothetical protein